MLVDRLGLAVFGFAFLLTAPGEAGELHIYEHNRSIIHWFVVGESIKATYQVPRAGLEAAGVKPGTVLFEGAYEGNRIVGTAYAFKPGCPAASYQVTGAERKGRIVLRGPAPVRSRQGCDVTGHSAESPHAELVFVYSATHH